MRDAGVGRVLAASLHQGIADIRPARLAFYEHWLTSEGLREGTIGVAPLLAVLSFLRQEGDTYHVVTTRAGEYAAEWTVLSMASTERAFVNAMPERLRQRLVLRLACRLVRSSYSGSRAVWHLEAGTADVELGASILLYCARAGVGSVVRLLRVGAHASVPALRSVRPCRGRGVSRNRRSDVRAAGGALRG